MATGTTPNSSLGAVVPASDLPQGVGAPVPASDLPGAKPPPPASDPASPWSMPHWGSTEEELKSLGSEIVRPLAKGAISIYGMVADPAVMAWNAIPGTAKQQLPSSYWEGMLDRVTEAPQNTFGKVAEGAESMLSAGALGASGGTSLAREGGALLRSAKTEFERLSGKAAEFVGVGLGGASPEDQAIRRGQRVLTKAAEQAQNAGYKIPPAYIGGTVGRTVQGLMGKAWTTAGFAASNEETTQRLAKSALGLNDLNELDEQTLQELRNEAYEKYDQLRALGTGSTDNQYLKDVADAGDRFLGTGSFGGRDTLTTPQALERAGENARGIPLPEKTVTHSITPLDTSADVGAARAARAAGEKATRKITELVPDESELKQVARAVQAEKANFMQRRFSASDAVEEIKRLRQASRSNLRVYDYKRNAIGVTQRQIAQALENQLGRWAEARGQGEVLGQFQAARTQLAKIRIVSDAMGPGGKVNARDIGLMLKRGEPLTGPLRVIADAANDFPDALAPVSRKGEEGLWSRVDFWMGGSGFVFRHPAMTGLAVARPVVRKTLASAPVQRAMLRGLKGQAPKGAASAGKALVKAAARGAIPVGVTSTLNEVANPYDVSGAP